MTDGSTHVRVRRQSTTTGGYDQQWVTTEVPFGYATSYLWVGSIGNQQYTVTEQKADLAPAYLRDEAFSQYLHW